MYVFRNYFNRQAGLKNKYIVGLGINNRRIGIDRIIPNIHTSAHFYTLIFNHDEVLATINSNPTRLAVNTLFIWDSKQSVFYGQRNAAWTISWLQCHPGFFETVISKTNIPLNTAISFTDDRLVSRYFCAILDEFSLYASPDGDIITNTLYGIALEVKRVERSLPERKLFIPEVLQGLHDFISSHYSESITLKKLANRAHLEPSYLSRRFKEFYGISPIDFLIDCRLSEAAQLLKNSDMQIQEIAAAVGYENIYHFSRLFKRYYGKSPSLFRS